MPGSRAPTLHVPFPAPPTGQPSLAEDSAANEFYAEKPWLKRVAS